MGKRKTVFAAVIVAAFLMLLTNSFSAEAAGSCQSKLVGNSYSCSVSDEELGTETLTFEFETGGLSKDFDMFDGTGEYGCACNSSGSVTSPKFDSSSSNFECISTDTTYMISGKVSGKKISGQGTSELGDSVVISCKLLLE